MVAGGLPPAASRCAPRRAAQSRVFFFNKSEIAIGNTRLHFLLELPDGAQTPVSVPAAEASEVPVTGRASGAWRDVAGRIVKTQASFNCCLPNSTGVVVLDQ